MSDKQTGDDELDPSIAMLARDWREAAERYRGPRCIAGCTCPMSQALDAVARFVAIVEAFERGELVEGLPVRAEATIDPAELPEAAPCVGCGAMMRARLGAPGTRLMFHPAPLCAHLLSKLTSMGFESPDPMSGYLFGDVPKS